MAELSKLGFSIEFLSPLSVLHVLLSGLQLPDKFSMFRREGDDKLAAKSWQMANNFAL